MAFETVEKAPEQWEINNLKRKYRKANKRYNQLRADFSYHINCEDFELISVEDFLKLKEAYIESKQLYWKLYELEHPEDTATPTAYRFLNTLTFDEKVEFLTSHGLTTHGLIDKLRVNPNFLDEVTA